LGGLVASGHSPRTTFYVAGIGVLLVLAIAIRSLAGTPWARGEGAIEQAEIDADLNFGESAGNVEEAQQPSVSGAAGRERGN
jgi:hypothetical protein